DKEGRYRLTIPNEVRAGGTVVAEANGLGPGWADFPADVPADGRRELPLQLVKDDVPITGAVVDLEGKPGAGATLRVLQISAAPGEDLGPWLEAVKGKKGLSRQLEKQYLKRSAPLSRKVTTLGRDRLVRARLDGPGLASDSLHILTRPGKAIA